MRIARAEWLAHRNAQPVARQKKAQRKSRRHNFNVNHKAPEFSVNLRRPRAMTVAGARREANDRT